MNRVSALVLMFALLASSTAAQQVPTAAEDPVADAPIRIGAVGLGPRVSLSTLGIDTNVFNSVVHPQSDFTFTVSPSADIWLRTGRGLVTISGGLEFIYFHEFETERAVNSNARGQYEFRFNRLRPYASASTLNTKQRPGYEIDVRARHYETELHAGTDLRLMSKSTIRVDSKHLEYTFAGDEVFNGQALNEQLNRVLRVSDLSWRQRLTALTTWVTHVSYETERFDFETARNSDSLRLSSGFELGRFALIRGSAFVGYRKLTAAKGGTIPTFSGLTSEVDVSYTAPSQTRLSAAVDRDVEYSYDVSTPYYIQTSWSATMTQRIMGSWDVQVTGGRDFLDYQVSTSSTGTSRVDVINRVGGGIGYQLAQTMRMSLDVNSFHRESDLPGVDYRGLRAGLAVTYGY